MGITVEELRQTGHREMVAVLAAPARADLTSAAARDLAIRAGTPQLGRCSFSGYGNWSYRNPPDHEHPDGKVLTDQDLMTHGAMRPGGRYLQEIVVRAGA